MNFPISPLKKMVLLPQEWFRFIKDASIFNTYEQCDTKSAQDNLPCWLVVVFFWVFYRLRLTKKSMELHNSNRSIVLVTNIYIHYKGFVTPMVTRRRAFVSVAAQLVH
jgi:hypothetical protein